MDPLGATLSIAHVLKRAYDLYNGCKSAPEEIRLAADHVHTMALVLEGVKSDLVGNRNSFIHQTTAIAISRTQNLKKHVTHCEKSLKRMEGVLKKYQGWKKNGTVALWDKFRWSTDGKKEIAECKADMVLCTSMLDLFLSKEGLSVLWKLESMIEIMMKRFEALELFQAHNATTPGTRPRRSSNVGRTLVLSLIITRLRKVLTRYRRRKTAKKSGPAKPSNTGPGPRRPKPVTRVSSGFAPNNTRNSMMHKYASTLAHSAVSTSPKKPPRARTPSPDFYYIPGGTSTPTPRPIRRSSSMQRLLGKIRDQASQTRPAPEHYECWKVGTGTLAFGAKIAPQFLVHRRGQMQLRKMAVVFKEASMYDRRALNEQDARVKAILKAKNGNEKKGGGKRKWYLVAGRVISRDSGRTGMVSVEKAMVVLVRR